MQGMVGFGGEKRGRVLLVEDDGATRNLISRHLGREGYVVTAVEAAEIGMVEAGEARFDAVISDVHLPGMSGIDLAGYLLAQDPSLPFVLVTGDPDEALAREALSRGPVSYLLKPFELFELDAAVQQAVGRRRESALDREAESEREIRTGTRIPDEWFELVDEKSYAGPGHADRVSRIAIALLSASPSLAGETSGSELEMAARTHEVGRLAGQASDPAVVAAKSAVMLEEAGFPPGVIRAVRHLYERWDGTGEPDRLSGSNIPAAAQLLSAADALDHYCAAWLQAGLNPDSAFDRSINLLAIQQGLMFSPVVVSSLQQRQSEVRAICAVPRGSQEGAPARERVPVEALGSGV